MLCMRGFSLFIIVRKNADVFLRVVGGFGLTQPSGISVLMSSGVRRIRATQIPERGPLHAGLLNQAEDIGLTLNA